MASYFIIKCIIFYELLRDLHERGNHQEVVRGVFQYDRHFSIPNA